MQLRDAGVWKPVNGIHLRDDGIWKPVRSQHIYRGLTPPAVGEWWEDAGGWYVGDDANFGSHLVVSDKAAEVTVPFGPSGPSLDADVFGLSNTHVIATGFPSTYQAAHYCWDFSSGLPGILDDVAIITPWFLASDLILEIATLAAAALPVNQRFADGTYWTSANDGAGVFYSIEFDALGGLVTTGSPSTTTPLRVRPVRLVYPAGWHRVFLSHADPFSLSGTFASNMDGWTGAYTRTTTAAAVRTSPGGAQSPAASTDANGDRMTYTLPAGSVRGLRVTVEFWYRRESGTASGFWVLAEIGGGAITPLPPTTQITMNPTTTYQQYRGYRDFDASFDGSAQVDIGSIRPNTTRIYFDDWSISAVPIP